MPMTIFYSWQMDTDSKANKRLIEASLKSAIKQVSEDIVLEDRGTDSDENQIELTSDTQGVLGTPDIFSVILEKISVCDVFVADVTLTGRNHANTKAYPNPNVCVEYGYAAGKIGFNKILLVMNTKHGRKEALPFDFQTRRKPVYYSSDDNSQTAFIGELKSILREYFEEYQKEHKEILELDWDVDHYGETDYGLRFGVKNNGDRAIKDVAIKFFPSRSFDCRKLRVTDPYGTSYWGVQLDSQYSHCVVRIMDGRVIHPSTTDWATKYNGVLYSLRPVSGNEFKDILFEYELSGPNGVRKKTCRITGAMFGQKGRIPQLEF